MEPPVTPMPDLPPNTGNAPITWVAYDYYTPGWTIHSHHIIPGLTYHIIVRANGSRFAIRLNNTATL